MTGQTDLNHNARQFLENLKRMGPQFAYGDETEQDALALESLGLIERQRGGKWRAVEGVPV